MNPMTLLYPVFVPIIIGLIILFLPQRLRPLHGALALLTTIFTFAISVKLFLSPKASYQFFALKFGGASFSFDLLSYHFGAFMALFVGLFGLLLTLYSLGYIRGKEYPNRYFSWLLITVGASCGAVLANNLLLFLVFWEIVTLMFYLLVTLGGNPLSPEAAKKSFAILGFSDCALLLGIVLLWSLSGTLRISDISVRLGSGVSHLVFILFMIGATTKAGAMPFHSWIPSAAEGAPTPVMAFLPASLDKLLGIYLLARISLDIFVMDKSMGMVLMVIGAVTIILAVMMALVQHNLKKLLSFHAISQVGYMVLGIGTGVPIGIMGGLFHMLNNCIYKCALFLEAGSVEKRTGTTELSKLGGLASAMPYTFFAAFISALSISGIPPFNGFVSKWMVYQGTIISHQPIFLVAAMFGSSLTLASFVKVLYSVFWGQRPKELREVKEVGFSMKVPMLILALLCIFFGVFAQFPLGHFIGPVIGYSFHQAPKAITFYDALWSPTLATFLIIIALVVGVIIYLWGRLKLRRTGLMYVGGETMDPEEVRVPGTGFYETISNLKGFKGAYGDAEKGVFDLYYLTGRYGNNIVQVLRKLHDGVLSTYLSWCIIGLGFLLFLLMR